MELSSTNRKDRNKGISKFLRGLGSVSRSVSEKVKHTMRPENMEGSMILLIRDISTKVNYIHHTYKN